MDQQAEAPKPKSSEVDAQVTAEQSSTSEKREFQVAEQWLGDAKPGDLKFRVFSDNVSLFTTAALVDNDNTPMNQARYAAAEAIVSSNSAGIPGYLESMTEFRSGPWQESLSEAEEIVQDGRELFGTEELSETEMDGMKMHIAGVGLLNIVQQRGQEFLQEKSLLDSASQGDAKPAEIVSVRDQLARAAKE